MLVRLGGQGRVALGAMLGAAVAALCCVGVLTASNGDTAHATEALPAALTGVSAAADRLGAPLPGAAAAAEVRPTTTTPPPTTTTPPPPPPTTTTTVVPTTPTTVVPTAPTALPTFPHPPFPTTFPTRHHCHRHC